MRWVWEGYRGGLSSPHNFGVSKCLFCAFHNAYFVRGPSYNRQRFYITKFHLSWWVSLSCWPGAAAQSVPRLIRLCVKPQFDAPK